MKLSAENGYRVCAPYPFFVAGGAFAFPLSAAAGS